jgi:hypothetical protein
MTDERPVREVEGVPMTVCAGVQFGTPILRLQDGPSVVTEETE